MKKPFVIIIIVAVVIGLGSFYCGIKYGQSISSNAGGLPFDGRQAGMPRLGVPPGGPGPAGRGFGGEIISKDDKSITVKLRDNGSKIIFYSGATEITKFTSGTSSDLEIGKTVMVNGKASQDGSITASSIQMRPDATRK